MTVGLAHLHSRTAPAERARQLATYLESFPATGRAVFGGDLNTTTTELSSWAHLRATARDMIANPGRFRMPQAYEPLFEHLPAAVCGSGDSFATGVSGMDCAVIDMEAYALAKVCWRENAKFACVKYITDGANHVAADDWQRNVHKAAEEYLRLFRGVQR